MVDPNPHLRDSTLQIVGLEPCVVISDRGKADCRLHYVNFDGDTLERMEINFVKAPVGEWRSNIVEPPQLVEGDVFSGQITWQPTCSLGGENFIGPVKWQITVTDEQGHVSPPFEASFNCVVGQ